MKEGYVSLPVVPRAPGTPRNLPTNSALVQYVAQGAPPADSPRPSSRMPKLMMSMSGFDKGSTAGWQNITSGSLRSTALSNGSGTTSRSARSAPHLANELELFMQRELLRLSKDSQKLSVFERIPIMSEAFNAFISRCTDYQEVLSRIKAEYDEAVAEGLKATRINQKLELLNENSMEYLSHIVSAEKISFEAQLREKERTIKEIQSTLDAHMDEYNRAIMEHHEMEGKVSQLTKVADDLRHKHRIATDGLQQETLLRSLMVQQGKKLKTENEKLTRKVTMLEFRIRNDALMNGEDGQASSPPLVGPIDSMATMAPSEVSNLQSHSSTARMRTGSVALAVHRSGSVVSPSSVPHVAAEPTLAVDMSHTHGFAQRAGQEENLAAEEKLRRVLHLFARERKMRLLLEGQLKESTSNRIDRPMTPRPQWHALRSVFPLWNASGTKSSEETLNEVVILLKDRLNRERRESETTAMGRTIRRWLGEENICESDLLRASGESFIGLGNGQSIPEYLRFHGLLRNRNLKKGDVESLLKEFWRDRKLRLSPSNGISDEAPPQASGGFGNGNAVAAALGGGSSTSSPNSIQSFFFEWLLRKTGNHTSAVELAYNILDVCSKFTRDPDCGMFLSILNSEIHESAYWDQLSIVEQLQVVMRHNDKNSSGLLKRARVHHILLKVFPAKSMDCMLKLRFSLLSHLNTANDSIRYAEVFEEDSDGNQSRFISLIREQHLREMTEYVVDMSEGIRNAASGSATSDENDHVSVAAIRGAIKLLDANMPSSKLESIIACGLDVPATSPEMDNETVDPDVFIQRIRRGILLCAYTRKDVDEADEVALAMLENLTDTAELGRYEMDDEMDDPAAKAALALMDQTLLQASASFSGGSPTGSDVRKLLGSVPSVVESTLQLLKPSTVDGMQKAGHLGRQRRI